MAAGDLALSARAAAQPLSQRGDRWRRAMVLVKAPARRHRPPLPALGAGGAAMAIIPDQVTPSPNTANPYPIGHKLGSEPRWQA
jgi:hypothetical protein